MTVKTAKFDVATLLIACVVAALATLPAHAQLRVDITRGTVAPLPIAVPEFFGNQEAERSVGRDIANVIAADLERSGLFKPIDRRAFIQQITALQVRPRFGDWRQINAQALVAGSAETQPDGRLRVEFRLWDVFA